MNENKHTPEPWRVEVGEQPESIAVLCTSGLAHFEIVSDSQLGDIHADARRITACVNACAGVDTEYLEVAPIGIFASKYGSPGYIDQLEKQRDELLAAMIHIQQVACSGSPELGIATDAIASVKGEQ